MIFNSLVDKINDNFKKKQEGGFTSIIPPFKRLAEKYPGWVKGTYTIITAGTGIGKTKTAKFFAVTSVYDFIKKNPKVKAKVFYFALEEGKDMFWLSMISNILYTRYNLMFSPMELLSLGSFTLSDDVINKINSVQDEVNDMEKYIDVTDHIRNPFGIYKYVRDWFYSSKIGYFEKIKIDEKEIDGKFVYYDKDYYVFCITDHISLLTPDTNGQYSQQKNLHEAMGYFSQEYCLNHFTKRLDMVTVNIQQQAADKEKQEFYRGDTIESKIEPSLDGLADNKLTSRDADLVLGVFAPTRYGLEQYRGYDINKLKDKYRCLKFLKDRHYGLANAYCHFYLNGKTNIFKELPPAQEMTNEIYEDIKNDKY